MCGELFSSNFEVNLNDDPGSFGGATNTRKCTDILGFLLMIIIFGTTIVFTVYCITEAAHYCVVPSYPKLYEFYVWIPAIVCVISIGYCSLSYCSISYMSKTEYKPIFTLNKSIAIICFLGIGFILIINFITWLFSAKKETPIDFIMLVVILMPNLYFNDDKKIHIIYQLLKEVPKATNLFQSICITPALFSIIIIAYIYGIVYCFIYLESLSYPEKIDGQTPDHPINDYNQYLIATMAQALVIYTIFFLNEFLKNLQCLMISGCVAQRYFTKKDDDVSDSTKTPLLKHMGTVCCASVILSVTFPIRVVVNAIKCIIIHSYKKCLYIPSRGLTTETLFLTRTGLIMTAIHGSSFCAGTIRARKLLYHNVFNAAEIFTFGDFTQIFLKLAYWFFLILYGSLITIIYGHFYTTNYESLKREVFYFACCVILLALLLDYCSSAVEIIIITIFLCFCEDCLYNNGTSKPYFMSANLAQFVENANKYVDEDKWNTVADKWNGGPGRLY